MPYKKNYTVYKITNIITNQCYIGIDSYFPKRINKHKSLLRNNNHINKYLQRSYNKYKNDNFSFEILLKCSSRTEMLENEIKFIAQYNSVENGFNCTIGGEGSWGYKHTKEALKKMSSWKRVITKEWRDNMSKAAKGVPKRKGIKRVNHPDYSKWIGGEKHPVSKLTQVEVNSIRNSYNQGITPLELSISFNVSSTQIYNIIKNRSWKDSSYKISPKRKRNTHNNNNNNRTYTNIICIQDSIKFKTIKETAEYYSCAHGSLYKNIRNLTKSTKTKYGRKSFKISID